MKVYALQALTGIVVSAGGLAFDFPFFAVVGAYLAGAHTIIAVVEHTRETR